MIKMYAIKNKILYPDDMKTLKHVDFVRDCTKNFHIIRQDGDECKLTPREAVAFAKFVLKTEEERKK